MTGKLYIFDLDHTLLAADSNNIWNQFLVENKIIGDCQFPQQEQQMIEDYDNGCMDIAQYIRFIMQPLCHLSIADIDKLAWQCVHERILPTVYPQASALLKQLESQRQPLLIISATVSFLVKKIASQLGVEHAIGIELQTDNVYYRPEIAGVASYQHGKVTRLQHWLADHPHYVGETWFYTDSINDLPLCEYADHVYLVNPCRKLRQHNQQTQWPMLNWRL